MISHNIKTVTIISNVSKSKAMKRHKIRAAITNSHKISSIAVQPQKENCNNKIVRNNYSGNKITFKQVNDNGITKIKTSIIKSREIESNAMELQIIKTATMKNNCGSNKITRNRIKSTENKKFNNTIWAIIE